MATYLDKLPKVMTAKFFESEEDYGKLKAHWSKLMSSDRKKELEPYHHLLYLALMGKDWRGAFSSITNKNKLANGGIANWGLNRALNRIYVNCDYRPEGLLAPFDGLVSERTLKLVASLLPESVSEWKDDPQIANWLAESYTLPYSWEQNPDFQLYIAKAKARRADLLKRAEARMAQANAAAS